MMHLQAFVHELELFHINLQRQVGKLVFPFHESEPENQPKNMYVSTNSTKYYQKHNEQAKNVCTVDNDMATGYYHQICTCTDSQSRCMYSTAQR